MSGSKQIIRHRKKRTAWWLAMLFLLPHVVVAQNWDFLGKGVNWQVRGLYGDTSDNTLYIVGGFNKANDSIYTPGIASWNDSVLAPLGCGFDWDCVTPICTNCVIGPILSVTKYKGEIYASGYFAKADNKPIGGIARWDGVTWDSVGVVPDGAVLGLGHYQGDLVAVGMFSNFGGVSASKVARWNGVSWAAFDTSDFTDWTPVAAAEYQGNLYIAGNSFGFNPFDEIAYWNGTTWADVGGGIKGDSHVNTMAVYNNELYVGGYFFKANGNAGNAIMKWDGSAWLDVGGGMDPGLAQVMDLEIYNGELYAVGMFLNAGGVPADFIAKWDGTEWCSLGSSIDNAITSIAALDSALYIGGGFWTIDGDSMNYLAKWTGGNYTDSCGVIDEVEEFEVPGFRLEIYPNPCSQVATIVISSTPFPVSFTIYDQLGRKAKEITGIETTRFEVNRTGLADGIYFYALTKGTQRLHSGKLAVISR